jgi:hypothetical protein
MPIQCSSEKNFIIWNRRMIWGKGASARRVGKEGIGIETAKYEVLLFGRA